MADELGSLSVSKPTLETFEKFRVWADLGPVIWMLIQDDAEPKHWWAAGDKAAEAGNKLTDIHADIDCRHVTESASRSGRRRPSPLGWCRPGTTSCRHC